MTPQETVRRITQQMNPAMELLRVKAGNLDGSNAAAVAEVAALTTFVQQGARSLQMLGAVLAPQLPVSESDSPLMTSVSSAEDIEALRETGQYDEVTLRGVEAELGRLQRVSQAVATSGGSR